MMPPVARVTAAQVEIVGCRRHNRYPQIAVRLTQMTSNGTVPQAGSSRIAARLMPTNTAQAISGHSGLGAGRGGAQT